MSDNNLDEYTLVLLDAHVNSMENCNAQQKFREAVNHVEAFAESDQCVEYIRSLSQQDRIVLVVSGALSQQVVPQVQKLRQISSIYIFTLWLQKYQQWANQFTKVK